MFSKCEPRAFKSLRKTHAKVLQQFWNIVRRRRYQSQKKKKKISITEKVGRSEKGD
jgi:hypothetical protein